MRTVSLVALVVFGLLSAACGKAKPEAASTAPSATSEASAATAPSAAPPPSASAAAAPAGSLAPAAKGAFKGAFTSKVGSVTTPKDVKDTTTAAWAKDSGKESVGPGTIELTLEGDRVFGTGKGSLGDLVLEGKVEGDEVRAVVNPKDPNASTAMTGVLSGKVDAGKIVGKIRASGRNGNIVREADVSLAP